MAGFNKILLLGNLTRDPRLSYTPSQVAVADFGVATNRRWTGPDGSQREETCFVDCRAFGRTAESINKFFKKGKPIFLEGRLTLDSWTTRDGSKHSKHRITVETFQFLPGTGGSVDQADQGAGPESAGQEEHPGGPGADGEIPF
jgi:single-strand DNA-binding protein